jgi:hypothetical protein
MIGNICSISAGSVKGTFAIFRMTWENNIKMAIREVGWWCGPDGTGSVAGLCEEGYEPSSFIREGISLPAEKVSDFPENCCSICLVTTEIRISQLVYPAHNI